jgi:hypothetical protein
MPQVSEPENTGIVGVARSMFLNSGYARTTVKSIAAAAGVAPTVVSNLYANKEALFAAQFRLWLLLGFKAWVKGSFGPPSNSLQTSKFERIS